MRTINQISKSDNKKASPVKRVVRGLLVVLLVISLFIYRDSFQEIWEGIGQVTTGELCIVILLAGAGYVMEGMTIFCMMGTVMTAPSVWDGIFIAYVCEFYRLTTLGNGSGVAEIHYLCQCGMGKHKRNSREECSDDREGQPETAIAPGSATVLVMIQYMMKRIAIMVLGVLGFLILYQGETTGMLCREYGAFAGIGCLITTVIIVVFLSLSLSDRVTAAILWVLDWLSVKITSREEMFRKWKEQIVLLNKSGKSVLRQKKRMQERRL